MIEEKKTISKSKDDGEIYSDDSSSKDPIQDQDEDDMEFKRCETEEINGQLNIIKRTIISNNEDHGKRPRTKETYSNSYHNGISLKRTLSNISQHNSKRQRTGERSVESSDNNIQSERTLSINSKGYSKTRRSREKSMDFDDVIDDKPLDIIIMGHQSVCAICSKYGAIYIGGTNGLLARHTKNGRHTYDAQTTRDIVHLEVVIRDDKRYVIAFTDMKILIYNEEKHACYKVIEISEIRNVFNDDGIIYIILKKGSVKKLYVQDLKITNEIANDYIKRQCYVPFNDQFALFTLQDSLLYSTTKKDLMNSRRIDGVSNIKAILRTFYNQYICHSDNTIWGLTEKQVICKTLVYNEGIHLVSQCYGSLAVADRNDVIRVYSLRSDRFMEKIFQKDITDRITALAITKNSIYIALKYEVLEVNYKSRP